ncbi:CDP-alcohol phosphatidyltransferase family protein [Chloroflexus sp.]|uniref:CDP-alcohol phosphatidyltransferase family protein n=1 Tax=Chloroflexus sp. TaxID=1904827 RepID=UPI002ADE8DFE|nr:CDP-alcohol phosphatidyltransferase family protein [Chloroflexus sp.]
MMPLLARFRQLYEQISLPLGHVCSRLGIHPNILTYLSLLFSVLAGYLLSQREFGWGIVVILLMGFADVLDGATARASGMASEYGTVLDHVTDRYAEAFVMGGLMLSGVVAPVWTLFAIFGMVMASYVRARAEATRKLASCNVGFAGRQEKLGLLLIGLILMPFFPDRPVLEWAVIAVGIVSHITAVQRLLYTRQMLVGSARDPKLRKESGII